MLAALGSAARACASTLHCSLLFVFPVVINNILLFAFSSLLAGYGDYLIFHVKWINVLKASSKAVIVPQIMKKRSYADE